MRPIPIIAGIVLALGAVEATAWWWMHPASTSLDQPVLVYQPRAGDRGLEIGDDLISPPLDPLSAIPDPQSSSPSTLNPQLSTSPTASPLSSSSASFPNQQSTINNQQSPISPSPTTTPLPELYDKAAPMLRCSSGQVFHTQLDETLGLHLAFFEWNDTDTGSVLEAFRHMPEACMGSIGMTLVSTEKPILYQVGEESLVFDHTIFREPAQGGGFAAQGPQVHAFRAIWVAGMAGSNARQGIGGDEFDNLRAIRLKSALTRFRPTHARVIQGAVRGAANGDAAWAAFEHAMLKDLKFQ